MRNCSHFLFSSTLLWRGITALLLRCGLISVLSSCTAVAVGGAVGGGMFSIARQEGGVSEAVEDWKISGGIGHNWLQFDANFINKFESTVREGRVLLTGVVAERGEIDDAVRLVWQVPGVREVYNEIEITSQVSGFVDFSRDIWIVSQLKGWLLLDAAIASINYTIDVTNGTIYLLGVARDRTELDHVLAHARNLNYVKRVVSYVRLKNNTQRLPP